MPLAGAAHSGYDTDLFAHHLPPSARIPQTKSCHWLFVLSNNAEVLLLLLGVRNQPARSCKARLKEILPLPQIPQTVGIDVKETLRGWPNFLPSWSWRELLARKSRAPMDSGLAE